MLLKRLYFLFLLTLSLAVVGCPTTGDDDDDSATDDDDATADDDDATADDDDATPPIDDDDATGDDDDATPPPGSLDCADASELDCGISAGTNVGASSAADMWPGCVQWQGYTGGEVIYEFTAAATEQVTIDLTWTDGTQDLDLFALPECNDNAECLSASDGVETAEQVSFAAVAGETYIIVVDGYDGGSAEYMLEVDSTCGAGDDDDATEPPDDDDSADDDDSGPDDDDSADDDDSGR